MRSELREKEAALRDLEETCDAQLSEVREESVRALREKEAAHDAQLIGVDALIISQISSTFCVQLKEENACNSVDWCVWKEGDAVPEWDTRSANEGLTSISAAVASARSSGYCNADHSKIDEESMKEVLVERYFNPKCAALNDCSATPYCEIDDKGHCVYKR